MAHSMLPARHTFLYALFYGAAIGVCFSVINLLTGFSAFAAIQPLLLWSVIWSLWLFAKGVWIVACELIGSCYVTKNWYERELLEFFVFIGSLALWTRLPWTQFLPLALLCAALAVTVYTDYKTFFIYRICTVYLIPIGFLASALGFLQIGLFESLVGAGLGYGVLMLIKYIHVWLTGREGLGAGDAELLAFIGAFTGPLVCWESLVLGSFIGVLVGVALLLRGKATRRRPLPLGACIALSAFVLVVTGWSPLASFLLV